MDKGIQKFMKMLDDMKKDPVKYPRYIIPPYGIGEPFRGFSVVEADNEEQLINSINALTPEFKVRFEPLIEISKAIEIYMKAKQ